VGLFIVPRFINRNLSSDNLTTGCAEVTKTRNPTKPTLDPKPVDSPLSTLDYGLTPKPFLGLTYLGPSTEQDHTRDYAVEALAAERAHQAELKKLLRRSGKDFLTAGILDGTYGRYLKGE